MTFGSSVSSTRVHFRGIAVSLFGVIGAVSACNATTPTQQATPTDAPSTEQQAQASHEVACEHEQAGGACGACGAMDGHGGGPHSERPGATTQLLHDRIERRTTPDGKTVTHAGMAFAGATRVTVAQLLTDPTPYAGKTVQVAGNVAAMCKHRRAWFAIVGDDQTGAHIRVLTVPSFLVPSDAMGKRALVEGSVEVIAVSASEAQHFAERHKLHYPAAAAASSTKRVVIRATGSQFL